MSATIGQLVWPGVIVLLVWMLRDPIKRLAGSEDVTRAKVGPSGIELEFKRGLAEAKREAESEKGPLAIEPPDPDKDNLKSDFLEEMSRLAKVSPRSVVLESYTRLVHFMRQIIDSNMPSGRPPSGLRDFSRLAVDRGLLAPQTATVLKEMTDLRNLVAHEASHVIDEQTALDYALFIAAVAESLARSSKTAGTLDTP